jgi:hypothetical protein
MTLYSQRDSRWGNQKLGYGDTTIGNFGCTITSLAQLLLINGHNETPATVNEKLKVNNGFVGTNKNLLVWTAIEKAFDAKHIKRGYTYNNNEVLNAIAQYGGCMVEVDGTRIGTPTHWVLYIGNQKMIDPWTGVEKATNYYPAKGYSVVSVQKRVGNPPDMPKTYTQEQWDKLNLENTDNWNKWKKAENDLASLRHENQDNWDKWQAELKKAAKLQSDLDGANAKADQRKKEYETLLETLAKKLTLPATSDISDIMGAIERLLSVEELLRKAEKDLAKQQEKHDQEKEQFIRDIEALRGAIDKQQKENETLLARINDLEKRLEAREEAIKVSSRFSIFLEKVLRIFK